MKLNPTADPGFLAEFSNGELSEYLQRLANVRGASTPAEASPRTHPDPTVPEHAATQLSAS